MDSDYMKNRSFFTAIIYATFLLDNILLTVIVPILPDFLASFSARNVTAIPSSVLYKNFDLHYIPNSITKHPVAGNTKNMSKDVQQFYFASELNELNVETENGKVGLLLAMKAFMQLLFNPIIGNFSSKFGYKAIIFFGTINLLLSSLFFAVGESFAMLLFARCIEGIGSSCINVCGMSLIAHLYPEDQQRSKIMGIILGSIALGVLCGYPLGGFLYDFVSESAPFIIISAFLFIDLAFQLTFFDLTHTENEVNGEENAREGTSHWIHLLSNKLIFTIAFAIFISTSAMSVLEPLLPIWLIAHLHPKKWQLGTVFIPDSMGYFIGTNFFGSFSYRVGQIKMSMMAIMIVGLSCVFIPEVKTVASLIIPHFCLGLGIGILDTSLVPYLARLADTVTNRCDESAMNECSEDSAAMNYGSVYAIQQTAVCLAYSIVPFMAGEIVQTIGFPSIMRTLGFCNFIYGPILMFITIRHNLTNMTSKQPDLLLKESNPSSYRQFYNSIE